jgi:hypothetical protein
MSSEQNDFVELGQNNCYANITTTTATKCSSESPRQVNSTTTTTAPANFSTNPIHLNHGSVLNATAASTDASLYFEEILNGVPIRDTLFLIGTSCPAKIHKLIQLISSFCSETTLLINPKTNVMTTFFSDGKFTSTFLQFPANTFDLVWHIHEELKNCAPKEVSMSIWYHPICNIPVCMSMQKHLESCGPSYHDTYINQSMSQSTIRIPLRVQNLENAINVKYRRVYIYATIHQQKAFFVDAVTEQGIHMRHTIPITNTAHMYISVQPQQFPTAFVFNLEILRNHFTALTQITHSEIFIEVGREDHKSNNNNQHRHHHHPSQQQYVKFICRSASNLSEVKLTYVSCQKTQTGDYVLEDDERYLNARQQQLSIDGYRSNVEREPSSVTEIYAGPFPLGLLSTFFKKRTSKRQLVVMYLRQSAVCFELCPIETEDTKQFCDMYETYISNMNTVATSTISNINTHSPQPVYLSSHHKHNNNSSSSSVNIGVDLSTIPNPIITTTSSQTVEDVDSLNDGGSGTKRKQSSSLSSPSDTTEMDHLNECHPQVYQNKQPPMSLFPPSEKDQLQSLHQTLSTNKRSKKEKNSINVAPSINPASSSPYVLDPFIQFAKLATSKPSKETLFAWQSIWQKRQEYNTWVPAYGNTHSFPDHFNYRAFGNCTNEQAIEKAIDQLRASDYSRRDMGEFDRANRMVLLHCIYADVQPTKPYQLKNVDREFLKPPSSTMTTASISNNEFSKSENVVHEEDDRHDKLEIQLPDHDNNYHNPEKIQQPHNHNHNRHRHDDEGGYSVHGEDDNVIEDQTEENHVTDVSEPIDHQQKQKSEDEYIENVYKEHCDNLEVATRFYKHYDLNSFLQDSSSGGEENDENDQNTWE